METNFTTNGFSVRPFEVFEDAIMLDNWAIGHGREGFPVELVPLHSGFVLLAGDEPIAACFAFETQSRICFVDFVYTCPGLSLGLARKALSHLLARIGIWARERGFEIIFTTLGQGLAREAERMGFSMIDKETSFLSMNLNEREN